MPIGVMINALAVLLGGSIGAFLSKKIPERLRITLPLIFGVASMAMGINSIIKMKLLPVVVLAVIVGTAIGELIYLEKGIGVLAGKARGPVEKIFKSHSEDPDFLNQFISIVVLFCASGTGIFGALQSGMTGDHTILFSKSILDFFTAMIFATSLGYLVATICIPQFVVLIILFFAAKIIMPMTTPDMLSDFTACGGVLMLATGLRISGIKSFPIANMLPAMLLVMPLSYLWTAFIVPLLVH